MKKNIVLCGSMKVKEKILEVKGILEKNGFNVFSLEYVKGNDKKKMSLSYFDKIVNDDCYLLIVNEDNNGIKNYIGPNTLCEIAFGFYYNRKVFLLYDIYELYKDELEAWGVISLNGDLNKINSFIIEEDNNTVISMFELTSMVSLLGSYPDMSKECERELLMTYYGARESAKISGDWSRNVDISNKPNLISFLNSNNIKKKIKLR